MSPLAAAASPTNAKGASPVPRPHDTIAGSAGALGEDGQSRRESMDSRRSTISGSPGIADEPFALPKGITSCITSCICICWPLSLGGDEPMGFLHPLNCNAASAWVVLLVRCSHRRRAKLIGSFGLPAIVLLNAVLSSLWPRAAAGAFRSVSAIR